MSQRLSATDWSRLLFLSAVWGCTFFFVAVAGRDLPPMTLVALRVGLAAAVLYLWLILTGTRLPSHPRKLGQFLVMGFFNNLLPFTLIFWAQTHIASGLAAILNASTPIFAMTLAHLLTRDDRLSPARAVGVLTGFAGVAVMVGLEALEGLSAGLLGQVAVLGAALSYACAGLYGRRFRGLGPAVAACGQLTFSSLLAVPLALVIDRPWNLPAPDAATVASVLALGLLGTALGYAVYFRILASAGAVNLLLVTLLLPAVAVLLGAGLLGETLAPRQVAGMALIALGLAVVDGRLWAALRRATAARTAPQPGLISDSG
jgi:drug/metabolite transporter (DMT)-like permease